MYTFSKGNYIIWYKLQARSSSSNSSKKNVSVSSLALIRYNNIDCLWNTEIKTFVDYK